MWPLFFIPLIGILSCRYCSYRTRHGFPCSALIRLSTTGSERPLKENRNFNNSFSLDSWSTFSDFFLDFRGVLFQKSSDKVGKVIATKSAKSRAESRAKSRGNPSKVLRQISQESWSTKIEKSRIEKSRKEMIPFAVYFIS